MPRPAPPRTVALEATEAAAPAAPGAAPVAPVNAAEAVVAGTPAKAGKRSNALAAVVIVGGVVAVVGTGIAVHYHRSSGVGAHPAGAGATISGRHFAQLTNKQIRARIEAAGQKITDEQPGDPLTVFVLIGTGRVVRVSRSADAKAADASEQIYARQPGATARDGTCVIHVELHSPALAHVLLDQITR
jgi:hypothetical protein